MLLWLISGAATILAVAALVRVRQLSRRLGRLTQTCWELRYEHDRLRARLDRVSPADAAGEPQDGRKADTTFVPLSSVRR